MDAGLCVKDWEEQKFLVFRFLGEAYLKKSSFFEAINSKGENQQNPYSRSETFQLKVWGQKESSSPAAAAEEQSEPAASCPANEESIPVGLIGQQK